MRDATHPTPDHLERSESSGNYSSPRKQNMSDSVVVYR